MGQLRNADSQDQTQFPGAAFVAFGLVPLDQCTEATRQSESGSSSTVPARVFVFGIGDGANLAGDVVTITESTGGNLGDFLISSNSVANLFVTTDPGNGTDVHFSVAPAIPPTHAGSNATTSFAPFQLADPTTFLGFDLTDRICVITASPTGNTGEFVILSNTNNNLLLATDPGASVNVEYFVKSNVPLAKQQTTDEIMTDAQAHNSATIMKGGQLYIDGTAAEVSHACSVKFDPV